VHNRFARHRLDMRERRMGAANVRWIDVWRLYYSGSVRGNWRRHLHQRRLDSRRRRVHLEQLFDRLTGQRLDVREWRVAATRFWHRVNRRLHDARPVCGDRRRHLREWRLGPRIVVRGQHFRRVYNARSIRGDRRRHLREWRLGIRLFEQRFRWMHHTGPVHGDGRGSLHQRRLGSQIQLGGIAATSLQLPPTRRYDGLRHAA
jgi:hypothetical protein